jgi:hypothetical protein
MHYVCIENNLVVSILNYEPNTPESVSVVPIPDEDRQLIDDQTHIFDIDLLGIRALTNNELNSMFDVEGAKKRDFLNSTDWKVLRHLREKALRVSTSLTEQQYLDLEAERQETAKGL